MVNNDTDKARRLASLSYCHKLSPVVKSLCDEVDLLRMMLQDTTARHAHSLRWSECDRPAPRVQAQQQDAPDAQ